MVVALNSGYSGPQETRILVGLGLKKSRKKLRLLEVYHKTLQLCKEKFLTV
jgi:hypothetical protein